MSRIGNKPVAVPKAAKVELRDGKAHVQGPKGKLEIPFPACIDVSLDANKANLKIARRDDTKFARAMHGTIRALLNNAMKGVSEGYERKIEVYGTGYSVKVDGKNLVLTVGYAHPVTLSIPAGITIAIEAAQTKGNETPAKFAVSGSDKQTLGQFVRSIKDSRPPEPYLGKGIRYAGEVIRRKQGKSFAGGGGG